MGPAVVKYCFKLLCFWVWQRPRGCASTLQLRKLLARTCCTKVMNILAIDMPGRLPPQKPAAGSVKAQYHRRVQDNLSAVQRENELQQARLPNGLF